VANATAVVFFGVGLNIFVTETLGAFGAASVLLALYLAFWSYVLGSVVLVALLLWLLMRKKLTFPKSPRSRPQSDDQKCLQHDHRDLLSPTRAA
jgi:O-antigen/teichoic acid export membrane protein